MPTTAPLSVAELTELLGPGSCWGPISWRAVTGSTNDDLAALARHGARAGQVLFSEHQRVGKGRFTRAWQDTPGTSVASSVLVAPRPQAPSWGWLSLLVGLAVREGIETYTGAQPGRITLKWPNDVLVDGRKVCGILCERVGDLAVLGWGLNICMDEDELPVPRAGSLLLAGLPHDKTGVLAAVLTSLQRWFELWQERGEVRSEYEAVCDTIGRQVNLHADIERSGSSVIPGLAVGVDATGAILIEDAEGGRRPYSAGDVVHLR
ncbi:MAG: biotin--[acetyl-CoA-carboxylase] ligase [Propionibacterium sp.]